MKKIILIALIALIPSFAFATTVTASVAGTLKVYQTLTATATQTMIWPAQFAIASTTAALTNTHGGAPATGIPNTVGDTQGRAGLVTVTGTGGTIFAAAPAAASITLTGTPSGSIANVAISVHGDTAYATAAPTAIPGSGNSQSALVYVKGVIPASSALVAGTYTGTSTINIVYN